MTPALRHWKQEMNYLMNLQDDMEAQGKKIKKSHLARVKFVAACIAAHSTELGN